MEQRPPGQTRPTRAQPIGFGTRERPGGVGLRLGVVPVHAPTTSLVYGVQDGSASGGFLPKGGKLFHSWFTLPSHGSFT